MWLLDSSRRLVPVGTPGEICFGGIVAAGYLAQPTLTAERFVSNPLLESDSHCGRQLQALGMSSASIVTDAEVPHSPTLFCTGDMAVRLPTGELRYIGRADRQVKLRGFRVELGEVETAARTYWDAPEEILAVVVKDELTLFVLANSIQRSDGGLRMHCASRLPEYMVPSCVIALKEFPRLVSGKVDVGALERGEHLGVVVESKYKTRESGLTLSLAQALPRVVSEREGVELYRAPVDGLLHALVADHIVLGRTVFPATGYLVLAQTVADALSPLVVLQSVFFLKLLTLGPLVLFVQVACAGKKFEVSSNAGADSSMHCAGSLLHTSPEEGELPVQYDNMRGWSCGRAADVVALYDRLHTQGLEYGPGYRTLQEAWARLEGGEMAVAQLQVRFTQQGTELRPADLDDALCLDQLLLIGTAADAGLTRLPFAVDNVRLQAASGALWAVRAPLESLVNRLSL